MHLTTTTPLHQNRRCRNAPGLLLLSVSALVTLGCTTAAATGHRDTPRPVRRFLEQHGPEIAAVPISDLESARRVFDHVRRYRVDADPAKLWRAYREVDPRHAWTGPVARFGYLHDPVERRSFTANTDRVPEVREQQTVLVHLRFVRVIQMAAAFRITVISDEERLIEFAYLEPNTANGLQQIRILADGTGSIIEHRSQYTSGRRLRDRLLYPPFHSRAIDEFHRGIAATVNARARVFSRAASAD